MVHFCSVEGSSRKPSRAERILAANREFPKVSVMMAKIKKTKKSVEVDDKIGRILNQHTGPRLYEELSKVSGSVGINFRAVMKRLHRISEQSR